MAQMNREMQRNIVISRRVNHVPFIRGVHGCTVTVETTALEIWEDAGVNIDVLVAGVGRGKKPYRWWPG